MAQAIFGVTSPKFNGVRITLGNFTSTLLHFEPWPSLYFGPRNVAAGDIIGLGIDMRQYYPNAPAMWGHIDWKMKYMGTYFDFGPYVNFEGQLYSRYYWGR